MTPQIEFTVDAENLNTKQIIAPSSAVEIVQEDLGCYCAILTLPDGSRYKVDFESDAPIFVRTMCLD